MLEHDNDHHQPPSCDADQDPFSWWDTFVPSERDVKYEGGLLQQHLPQPHRVLAIDVALAQYPELHGLIAELEKCMTPEVNGLALTWETGALKIPELESLGHTALVMQLPAQLEGHLDALIRAAPGEMNLESLDHVHCVTTWAWELPDDVSVHLDAEAVRDVLRVCIAENLPTPGMLPVVLVAGRAVAFGGLSVSPDWSESLGLSQSSSGSNWNPYRIYDADEMVAAEKRAGEHGQWPSFGRLWHNHDAEPPYIMLPYFTPVQD